MRGCTQCGECLNVCPVFRHYRREEYSPKAKRLLLEPVHEATAGPDMTWADVASLARLCAGCGRCAKACARKLSTADLLADVRAEHPHWSQYFWELWIRRLGPFWPAVGLLADLVPHGLSPHYMASSLAAAKALAETAPQEPWVRLVWEKTPENLPPVALFAGCTAKNVRPAWGGKAVSLLQKRGYPLCDTPAFVCCGNTMHHAGRYTAMDTMRRTNIEAWKTAGKPRLAIFCASCHHGLAAYPEQLFTGTEAAEWREALTPLSVLLADATAQILPEKPGRYTYHQPCHWEKDTDKPFLSRILPGLAVGEALCCGMGGILKLTEPDLSAAMARDCLAAMPPDAPQILTGCSGCAMQLAAFAPARHWLDVVTG